MEYNNFIIDSGVWIASLNEDDSNHKKALLFDPLYVREQTIPDIVFYEVLTVLKNKKLNDPMNMFIEYTTKESCVGIRLFYEYNREVLKLFSSPIAEGLSYVDTLLLYLSRNYYILTFDERLQKRIKEFGGLLIGVK